MSPEGDQIMAEMHSQFVTGENEQTAVSVTRDDETNAWGVTLVAIRKTNGTWRVHYQITFGAYADENSAYELYAKMANAMEYQGCLEVGV